MLNKQFKNSNHLNETYKLMKHLNQWNTQYRQRWLVLYHSLWIPISTHDILQIWLAQIQDVFGHGLGSLQGSIGLTLLALFLSVT